MKSAVALKIENGLATETREAVVRQLAEILDAAYSLMIRTQACHWNVEGPLFEPLHKLTEAQYSRLFANVDDIAERMRALDGKPAANVNVFPTGVSNLPASQTAEAMISDLIRHHESLVRLMRKVVGAAGDADDVVTADLLTGMMAQHEKDVWMLRATLKR